MYKKLFIAAIFVVFLATSAFGFWTVRCENFIADTRITAEVTIPKSGGFQKMYEAVFSELSAPLFFRYYLIKIKEIDRNLKYGYYKVTDTPLKDFLDSIVKGKQSTMKITFPEGFNTYDMADKVGRFIVADGENFLTLTRDPQYIYDLTGQNLPSLEGYLYPNTYSFPPFTSPRVVIRTMYWMFRQQLPADIDSKAAALGMSVNDIIILASVIQKETYDPAEAPIIASVYYNRLRKNMRLQADPTVIYGLLPNFDGNLKKSHLQDTNNPYNTYRFKGLPPTPICNPSKLAIEAALNPANTDYLYFVADKNHKHTFTADYNQQINNVNLYQKQ